MLVLHRSHALSAGVLLRRRRPHLLRARCRPLIGTAIPFVLAAREVLHVTVYVSALDELEIRLDEATSNEKPVA